MHSRYKTGGRAVSYTGCGRLGTILGDASRQRPFLHGISKLLGQLDPLEDQLGSPKIQTGPSRLLVVSSAGQAVEEAERLSG